MRGEDDSGLPAPSGEWANTRRAAEVLLREHPDAMVFAQTADGQIVDLPPTLGFAGDYLMPTEEARTALDLCVAEDRMTVVNAWIELKREAVAEAKARLRSDPSQWWAVRMLDLRSAHGVILTIGWPTAEGPADDENGTAPQPVSTTPRFCTRKQDEEGDVIDCDEAYLEMFGYSRQQVIGNPTFERVHPEDQTRVIEAWVAVVATKRAQMFRVRMRRGEGSWLWVDTTLHNFLDDETEPHILAECIDVSAETAAQEALQDREELLRRLIEEMPDGLLQLDRDRNVIFHNARLVEILGGDEPHDAPAGVQQLQAASRSLEDLLASLSAQSRAAFDTAVADVLARGTACDLEAETAAEGEARHTLFKIRPLQRDSGLITGAIASVLDVTDSARARRELERRATFDPLTGAHNRASILSAVEEALRSSRRPAILYIDLDGFKGVNDSLGHAAGDEVLIEVARRLRTTMRESDELGRLGGDEFLVLLRDVGSDTVARDAAARIGGAVNGRCRLTSGTVELRASVGFARASGRAVSAEALIERADQAMYRAKHRRHGQTAGSQGGDERGTQTTGRPRSRPGRRPLKSSRP